jgi:ankyrin repeat protein
MIKRTRVSAKKLIDAIEDNDTATASSLISSGSVNLNSKPWPLHHAAEFGRVEIMAMLLDAGANINAVDKNHRTASHVAIWHDQFDALKLLVERGANLSVVDSDSNGQSLLASVAQYGKDERFAFLLLDAGAPLDGLSNDLFLMSKVLVNSVAVFNRLLAHGVNFTTMRDENGATLCHCVARNITSENDFRFLVCHYDAVHAADDNGRTPLHWAASFGNDSAVRVLVECGAEIDRQANDGRTALIDASSVNWRSPCVELLIALGVNVGVVTNDGMTACHFAALFEKPAALCALVAAGGDLDQSNNKGETPRRIALRKKVALPTADKINAARQRIAKSRLDSVRERAFQICVGLQPLNINALQLCEILKHSFGALSSLILFNQWWKIAVKVKHFRDHKQQSSTTTTTSTTNNETQ